MFWKEKEKKRYERAGCIISNKKKKKKESNFKEFISCFGKKRKKKKSYKRDGYIIQTLCDSAGRSCFHNIMEFPHSFNTNWKGLYCLK